ncbi:hypothetical protein WN51_05832 [Melipona quadrifasciata]|uniref:Uncharacterized protein n=1 Tax=Melipona quadrifasciata TaxID=166423 RepID=A0A0N1ITX5_9HYME|nr:hypothetical protein WN51_05832 [Melipona quadrifasciata]
MIAPWQFFIRENAWPEATGLYRHKPVKVTLEIVHFREQRWYKETHSSRIKCPKFQAGPLPEKSGLLQYCGNTLAKFSQNGRTFLMLRSLEIAGKEFENAKSTIVWRVIVYHLFESEHSELSAQPLRLHGPFHLNRNLQLFVQLQNFAAKICREGVRKVSAGGRITYRWRSRQDAPTSTTPVNPHYTSPTEVNFDGNSNLGHQSKIVEVNVEIPGKFVNSYVQRTEVGAQPDKKNHSARYATTCGTRDVIVENSFLQNTTGANGVMMVVRCRVKRMLQCKQ